jgi:twitching motility two-component system response regulator PilH
MDKKRILVVDDNRMLAMTAERVLQKQGYETASALNGPEGLQKAQQWKPDLIILDIVMPGMDGYEVSRQLKRYPDTVDIPIIFLSSKGNTDETEGPPIVGLKEINKAFNSGANDFLHKPVAAADLLRAVNDVFGLYKLLQDVK